MSALTTLLNGGDDQQGGPVQCTLLAAAAAAVPEEGSLELQAIQAIEASLTYPQPAVKVTVAPHCFDAVNSSLLITVQCTLLATAAAAGAVPEKDSLELQAIQAIEASLTYPQAPVKVKIMSCELPLPCAITQGIWC